MPPALQAMLLRAALLMLGTAIPAFVLAYISSGGKVSVACWAALAAALGALGVRPAAEKAYQVRLRSP